MSTTHPKVAIRVPSANSRAARSTVSSSFERRQPSSNLSKIASSPAWIGM